MKRWVKGLTAAGVAALLTVPAFAAFSDVPENAWYAADVEAVQEYGIINGVGDNRFDPDGTLTIAEALTMAVRTNARHNGTEVPAAEGAWYQGAVNYATENGMISGTEFADKFLMEAGVATVPGTAFDSFCNSHIRLSYASSMESLQTAVSRLKGMLKK